jgi:(p)ppGpp synthase/HD superfamily hydrolase
VLTPDGDIAQLPKGATPLDFAYWIHTEIGNQCVGVEINGNVASLNTELTTGDIVKLKTDRNKKYIDEKWLEYVVTYKAKKEIEKRLRE